MIVFDQKLVVGALFAVLASICILACNPASAQIWLMRMNDDRS